MTTNKAIAVATAVIVATLIACTFELRYQMRGIAGVLLDSSAEIASTASSIERRMMTPGERALADAELKKKVRGIATEHEKKPAAE